MNKNRGGFTILETMIVMGVTATLLVTTIATFDGRQQRVQFSQSLRDIDSLISDVINDVSVGYFPSSGDRRCTAVLGNSIVFQPISQEQGSNYNCIFLGKAMHFQESQMRIHSLIGLRSPVLSDPLRTICETAEEYFCAIPVSPDFLAENRYYQWGTELKNIYWGNDPIDLKNSASLVVIASSPNGNTVTDNQFSATQKIKAYSSGSNLSTNYGFSSGSPVEGVIQNSLISWPASGKVVLCFSNGSLKGGIVISGTTSGVTSQIQLPGDGTIQCA